MSAFIEPKLQTYGIVINANKDESRKYTKMFNNLIFDDRISLQARFLYLVLKSYAWECANAGGVFPGQQRLSEQLGVTVRSVRRYTDELIASGLVIIERVGWDRTNNYTLTDQIDPAYAPTGSQSDVS
jgi:hypothetical protein